MSVVQFWAAMQSYRTRHPAWRTKVWTVALQFFEWEGFEEKNGQTEEYQLDNISFWHQISILFFF